MKTNMTAGMTTIKGIWKIFKNICWANFDVLFWVVLMNCGTWLAWSSIGAFVARYPDYVVLWYLFVVGASFVTIVTTTVLGAESYVAYLIKMDEIIKNEENKE